MAKLSDDPIRAALALKRLVLFGVEDEMEMVPAVRAVRTDRILALAAELEGRP